MFLWVPYISPLLMRVFSLPVILQFLSWPFITFFFMLLSLSNWFPISNLWLLCDDPALLARLLLFFFCKLLKLTFLLLKIHTIYHEWHKNITIGHLYLLCSNLSSFHRCYFQNNRICLGWDLKICVSYKSQVILMWLAQDGTMRTTALDKPCSLQTPLHGVTGSAQAYITIHLLPLPKPSTNALQNTYCLPILLQHLLPETSNL